MLNVGMTEILCFAVIAILVLGPDKLPEAARFAGRWYARIKRYISNLQNEIDQELRLSEFRKEMQDELNRIEALERKVQQQLEEIQKQTSAEVQAQAETQVAPQTAPRYTFVSGHHKVPFHAKFRNLASQVNTTEKSPHELKIAV